MNVVRRVPTAARRVLGILRWPSAGLLLMGGWLVTAQAFGVPVGNGPRQPTEQAYRTQARLAFEVLGTYRESATGSPQTETHATLGVGQTVTRYLVAGRADGSNICEAGFINDPSSVRSAYLWQLEARVLAVSPSTSTVQVRWSRSRTHEGSGNDEAGDTRTLTLGLGEFQNLDYVTAPPDSPSGCANLLLRLLVDPLPLPDPQPLLTIDVWLTHDRAGRRRWVHQQISARSGQPVAFHLEPLRWSSTGAAIEGETEGPAIGMGVDGTIAAILRPEGFLDVSVQAVRSFTWGRARLDAEGQQDFRCGTNEPVALVFPEPSGHASTPGITRGGTLAPGVISDGERTVVDFARFFSRSEGALYLVVQRR